MHKRGERERDKKYYLVLFFVDSEASNYFFQWNDKNKLSIQFLFKWYAQGEVYIETYKKYELKFSPLTITIEVSDFLKKKN